MTAVSGANPRRLWPAWLLVGFGVQLAGWAWAAAPAPPSNLSASCTVPSSSLVGFKWVWQDNSTNEDFFDIQYRFNSSDPWETIALAPSNSTSYADFYGASVTPGTIISFRMKSVKSTNGTNESSSASNTYILTIPSASFNAPGQFTATLISGDTVALRWKDNSTTEEGFYIEAREVPGGSFAPVRWVWFNTTNMFLTLVPGADYEFRMRGAKGSNPEQYTGYSSTSLVQMPFAPPTNLTASATTETNVHLAWPDSSDVEDLYVLQWRFEGDETWYFLTETAANVTNVDVGVYPGSAYEFRMFAGYQYSADGIAYSQPSAVATATTPFYAPSNLQAVAVTDSEVSLTWQDNSQVETGYQALIRDVGATSWQSLETYATSAIFDYLYAGQAFEFAVRAYFEDEYANRVYSDISSVITVATHDAFDYYRDYEPIQYGVPFTYQIETTLGTSLTSLAVGTLPDGLTFNPSTAEISGTPTVSGVYQVPMEAVFADGWTNSRTLTLRIVRPAAAPLLGLPIADAALSVGGTATVELADKFSDPDVESAVRMSTSVGDIDIMLYASLTPETVTNFLGYVNRGDYEGVTIHRADPAFVVQGGGYKATAAPDSFAHIPTVSSPTNEPGISNVRGTIAMAKRGGDPNSATSEFFFNLADNNDPDQPMSLDNQNGGFTVFGRVSVPGMQVVDAIEALPRGTYAVDLEGFSWTNDWPMNAESAPPDMDQSKLVQINSVAPIPLLSHGVASNTNPAVVDAAVTNGQLTLCALAPGESAITIAATDLDGNTVFQTFDVEVTQSFAQWAGASSFPGGLSAPGDDADHDGLCNLHEFAFLTDPGHPDGPNGQPVFSLSGVPGALTPKITFKLRKYTDALSCSVEASNDLVSWETIWDSGDGLSLPHVQAQDQGAYYLIDVEQPEPPLGAARQFLRVRVSSAGP